MKRPARDLEESVDSLPKKFEAEFRDLNLVGGLQRAPDVEDAENNFMQGVEGKHIAVIDSDDWLDLDNLDSLEIDQEYLRIPPNILTESRSIKSPFEQPSQALVLYDTKGHSAKAGDNQMEIDEN